MINEASSQDFQTRVWSHYREQGRHDLPWRRPEADGSFDAYKVLVSELMLQQTQVSRVIPKYQEFLARFPDAEALARAPLGEVLRAWNGLGYNRRAKFLRLAAIQIVDGYEGRFPDDEVQLLKLPGIGQATARAILAYAFDKPVVFVETNVRTVFIHHFFDDRAGVADEEIIELAAEALPGEHYREWYWALMDYGTYLKKTVGNLSRRSTGYAKQPRFEGSLRQIRGRVLRSLAAGSRQFNDLRAEIGDPRLDAVIADLASEGMIRRQDDILRL